MGFRDFFLGGGGVGGGRPGPIGFSKFLRAWYVLIALKNEIHLVTLFRVDKIHSYLSEQFDLLHIYIRVEGDLI